MRPRFTIQPRAGSLVLFLARRTGDRCLFVVENRDTPLFLAVVER